MYYIILTFSFSFLKLIDKVRTFLSTSVNSKLESLMYFEMKSSSFVMTSRNFAMKSSKFVMKSSNFVMNSSYFGIKSSNFAMKSSNFVMKSNNFAIKSSNLLSFTVLNIFWSKLPKITVIYIICLIQIIVFAWPVRKIRES